MGLGIILSSMGLWVHCALGAAAPEKPKVNEEAALRAELVKIRAAAEGAERWTHEARALFYLAEAIPDPDEQMTLYTEGRDLAVKARAAQPKNSGAILWWAANHGGIARLKKNIWALGALKDIEKALLELKAMDPDFGYAAASRVLGKIYLEAPGFISIGSNSRSKENIQDSLKRAPGFPGNELGYVEWLFDEGEKEKATSLMNAMRSRGALDSGDFGEFEWERGLWKKRFEELRRKGNLP
jgi:hypothetical protein